MIIEVLLAKLIWVCGSGLGVGVNGENDEANKMVTKPDSEYNCMGNYLKDLIAWVHLDV